MRRGRLRPAGLRTGRPRLHDLAVGDPRRERRVEFDGEREFLLALLALARPEEQEPEIEMGARVVRVHLDHVAVEPDRLVDGPLLGSDDLPERTDATGGGGLVTITSGSATVALTATYPSSDDTWTVSAARVTNPSSTWTLQAYVISANVD